MSVPAIEEFYHVGMNTQLMRTISGGEKVDPAEAGNVYLLAQRLEFELGELKRHAEIRLPEIEAERTALRQEAARAQREHDTLIFYRLLNEYTKALDPAVEIHRRLAPLAEKLGLQRDLPPLPAPWLQ